MIDTMSISSGSATRGGRTRDSGGGHPRLKDDGELECTFTWTDHEQSESTFLSAMNPK